MGDTYSYWFIVSVKGIEWLGVCLTSVLWSGLHLVNLNKRPQKAPSRQEAYHVRVIWCLARSTGTLKAPEVECKMLACTSALLAPVRNIKSFAEEHNPSNDSLTLWLLTRSGGCAPCGGSAGMFSPGKKAAEHYGGTRLFSTAKLVIPSAQRCSTTPSTLSLTVGMCQNLPDRNPVEQHNFGPRVVFETNTFRSHWFPLPQNRSAQRWRNYLNAIDRNTRRAIAYTWKMVSLDIFKLPSKALCGRIERKRLVTSIWQKKVIMSPCIVEILGEQKAYIPREWQRNKLWWSAYLFLQPNGYTKVYRKILPRAVVWIHFDTQNYKRSKCQSCWGLWSFIVRTLWQKFCSSFD